MAFMFLRESGINPAAFAPRIAMARGGYAKTEIVHRTTTTRATDDSIS
jgi:hypothetical protein